MKSTLIIYSSTDGQTKNICLRIGETLSNDVLPKIISLSEATSSDIEKYDQKCKNNVGHPQTAKQILK